MTDINEAFRDLLTNMIAEIYDDADRSLIQRKVVEISGYETAKVFRTSEGLRCIEVTLGRHRVTLAQNPNVVDIVA